MAIEDATFSSSDSHTLGDTGSSSPRPPPDPVSHHVMSALDNASRVSTTAVQTTRSVPLIASSALFQLIVNTKKNKAVEN